MSVHINRTTKDAHDLNHDYDLAHDYWTNQDERVPEFLGVADIGGGGPMEITYRHHEELRHLRKIVSFNRGKTILELGCGNGRWVMSLAPDVKQYVAVDFSKQMLDIARGRAEQLGLTNVIFSEAAAQDYFPSMKFDIVYLAGVSQYLHDAELVKLLQRMLRHLNPHGIIVDRTTIHCRRRCLSEQPGYFSIYRTKGELISLFESGGLENYYSRESYTFLGFPVRFQKLLRRPWFTRIVAATAPFSYVVLRTGARVSRVLFKQRGELLDYSHDLFLFRRKEEDGAKV